MNIRKLFLIFGIGFTIAFVVVSIWTAANADSLVCSYEGHYVIYVETLESDEVVNLFNGRLSPAIQVRTVIEIGVDNNIFNVDLHSGPTFIVNPKTTPCVAVVEDIGSIAGLDILLEDIFGFISRQ